MGKCTTDPCDFRMVMDGTIHLSMSLHVDEIVISGADATCGDFRGVLDKKSPTNNLETLIW